jgi:hypothetical protein
MKKLLFLILINCSLVSFGQPIKVNGSFEIGHEKRGASVYTILPSTSKYCASWNIKSIYATLYFDAAWKGITSYTSVKTNFNKVPDEISFDPLQSEYVIGLKYSYKKTFVVGYEHLCSHSIDEKLFNDSYTRFYFKIKMF